MSGESVYDRLAEASHGFTQDLVGRISTLLDSSLTDDRQAKAAKDLARGIIWQLHRERERMECEVLLSYWKNPKLGIIPEWLEREEKEKS